MPKPHPHLIAGITASLAAACFAAEPQFYRTGIAPGGSDSRVIGLSRDGSVAVGYTGGTGNPSFLRGFTWTAATGRVDINDPTLRSRMNLSDVSDDGMIVVGAHCNAGDGSDRRVIVGRVGTPYVQLPLLSGYSRADGNTFVSGDGAIVSGTCYTSGNPGQAFVWTTQAGIQGLGFARSGDSRSQALGMSGDGSTVVGLSENISQGTGGGFVWTAATGMRPMPGLFGLTDTHCRGANADGSIIVGETGHRATLWDADRVAHDLGSIPGLVSDFAYAVSDDGSIVVGYAINGNDGLTSTGTIWTPQAGLRRARDVLAERGVAVPSNFTIRICFAVSADGSTIAGLGRGPSNLSEGFVAYMGRPCLADFNDDGGIDGLDVESFFASWESGAPRSDVNSDGGIDGADIESFFASWEAGGC